MNIKYIAIVLLLPIALFAENNVDDIRWIAQIYPPYSYIDDDGKKKGVVIELLDKILKDTSSKKLSQDVEMRAFSKMFIYMNNDKNTVFFPLAKLPQREKMFKWVCPIFEDKPVIYSKNEINNISSSNELKKYKIAGRDGYNGSQQLADVGVSLKLVPSNDESILALKNGEVDMVVCDELSCSKLLPEKEYKVAYRLQSAPMCFAFNKDTNDKLVEMVRNSIK